MSSPMKRAKIGGALAIRKNRAIIYTTIKFLNKNAQMPSKFAKRLIPIFIHSVIMIRNGA